MSDVEKEQAALLEDVFGKDSDEEGPQQGGPNEAGDAPAQGPSAADLEDDDQEARDAGAYLAQGFYGPGRRRIQRPNGRLPALSPRQPGSGDLGRATTCRVHLLVAIRR